MSDPLGEAGGRRTLYAYLHRLDELDRPRGKDCKGYRAATRTSRRTRREAWNDDRAGLLDRRSVRYRRHTRRPRRRERHRRDARTWLGGQPEDYDASRLRPRRDVRYPPKPRLRSRASRTHEPEASSREAPALPHVLFTELPGRVLLGNSAVIKRAEVIRPQPSSRTFFDF